MNKAEFKKRLEQNRAKGLPKEEKQIVVVNNGDIVAIVDTKDIAKETEIKNHMMDLLKIKTDFKVGEIIDLNNVVDAMFNLKCINIKDNRIKFSVC